MAVIRAVVVMLMVVAGLTIAAGPASALEYSGDVDVILRANGILDINGDNDNNRITVCQNPADGEEFTVIIITSGSAYTTETRVGVTKDVRINMRGGDDHVQVNGGFSDPADCGTIYPPPPPAVGNNAVCNNDEDGCHHQPSMLFPRDLRVLLGSGHNSFNGYDFGVVDDLTVRGGSGFEEVTMSYVNVWDRADVNVLSGGSFVSVFESYFGRSAWRSGSGNDRFFLRSNDLGNRPIVTTSAGDDVVIIDSHAEGRATINTGAGADWLIMNSYCPGAECLSAGGEDRFSLNVIMGAHNDRTSIGFPLIAGDRLNGGSGNEDTLETVNVASITATGGPTINGYELIVPYELEP